MLDSWHFWIGLVWCIYAVVLAAWVILEKRPPASTIAWVFCLAILPGLGIVIYYIFGPRKIKRQQHYRNLSKQKVRSHPDLQQHNQNGLVLESHHQELSCLAESLTDYAASYATDFQVLSGGVETFQALYEAIDQAQYLILMEYYTFNKDHTGQLFKELLTKKARQGVQVYLLIDALASWRTTRKYMREFTEAGGHLEYFHDINFRRLQSLINMRNHRKIAICDGQVAFFGGVNITDQENLKFNPEAFHDAHMRVKGPIVDWFELLFAEDWAYSTRKNLHSFVELIAYETEHKKTHAATHAEASNANVAVTYPMQLIPAGPDNQYAPVLRVMVNAIYQAKEFIYLTTPYFIPDISALHALTSVAKRGVDVRILVPQKPDSFIVEQASQSWYEDMLKAGVNVYAYTPRMLHSKHMVIDHETAFIGSSNFDNRSFYLNFELMVACYGADVTDQLIQEFEQCLQSAQALTLKEKSFVDRLIEATARLFSPIL
ncbi:cardiolipin synthase [Brackiella oedipodis]|uniref:cardiolipin synthase n=1 Tax=Brackiella oedipodis TaxID=124225 RepID=UPI00056E8CC4|nr:cardiolipin synthase [Brackiella oedipodis]